MSKTTRPLSNSDQPDAISGVLDDALAQPTPSAAATIGDPRVLIDSSDPHNLIGELDGTRLRLTWRWPDSPHIQVCVVVWRADHWPELPDERDAHMERVARRSYDAHSSFTCEVPADLSHVYVRVYSALLEAHRAGFDTWFYSPGLETTSRQHIQRSSAVMSRLVRRRNARHPEALELRTIDGSPLPQLLIVRSKDLPLRASEGLEFARYPGGASQWTVQLLEAMAWPRGTWIRVFSSVDGFYWRAERCNHQL